MIGQQWRSQTVPDKSKSVAPATKPDTEHSEGHWVGPGGRGGQLRGVWAGAAVGCGYGCPWPSTSVCSVSGLVGFSTDLDLSDDLWLRRRPELRMSTSTIDQSRDPDLPPPDSSARCI
jgi:hypothetical protein